jgi:N4-gp56 family major capsid protein
MGKTIKRYHYMPMLDVLNSNDQGINAAGAVIAVGSYFVRLTRLVDTFAVEANATAAAAAINAISAGAAVKSGSSTPWTVTFNSLDYTATSVALANTAIAAIPGSTMYEGSGNLYGSSKDIGYISAKLPALSENGGRVNRVGFKRIEITGTLAKFGFFDEYSQESMDFDTDDQLEEHINREMIFGANEMTEDALQIDLLNGAGVVRYCGAAISKATMTGVTADTVSEVTYADLMKLSITLDNNRCPKNTKIITGSRMVDTKVINAARIMYIGSELIPTIEKMTDHFNNAAFIPVAHYADTGTLINGEIGTVGSFRICVVPEMMHWAGAGALEGTNAGYRETNGRYDVYPMLVVGDSSFTTIGFQTDGKSVKFKIYHNKPGENVANHTDPFGETGFMSIKWYYGSMILRPERLAIIYTVAQE